MPQRRTSTASALLWSAASGVAVPLATLVTAPILARALGPEGRGAVAAVGVPVAVLPVLLSFGLGDSLLYHVAGRRLSTRTAVRLAVLLGAGVGLLSAAALWALAPLLLRQFPDQVGLMRALALTVPVATVLGSVRGVAYGQGRFGLVSLERVLTTAVRVVGVVGAFALGLLTVASSLWITFLAALAAALVLVPLAARAVRPEPAEPESEPDPAGEPEPESAGEAGARPVPLGLRAAVRPVSGYGLRTWVGSSVGFLLARVDMPVLALVATPRQLGLYAVAAAVAELPTVALGAVRDVVFSRSAGQGAAELAATASRALLLVAGSLALVGAAALPVVLPVVFGADFAPAVPVAQVLLLAAVPAALAQVLGVGLLGIGRTWPWSAVTAGNLVLSVGLLLVLAPVFGGLGAALGVAVARTAAFLALAAWFARATGIPVRRCVVPGRADVALLRERLGGLLSGRRRRHRAGRHRAGRHRAGRLAGARTATAARARALGARALSPAVLVAVGGAGATAVLVLALHVVGPRLALAAGLVLAVGVATLGTSGGVRVALVVLPFLALVRRVTAGPDAFLENDPLVVLPMALCLPALLVALPRGLGGVRRWLVAYLLWLGITAALALPTGVMTVGYGLVFAGLPVVIGLLVAAGAHPGLPRWAFGSVAVLSVPAALYGVVQGSAPARWDIAWLTSVQSRINSIGPPIPGAHRVFGSMEAPLPYALYLGFGALVVLAALLAGAGRDARGRLRPAVVVAATAALLLLLAAILLSSVRSVLFALPVVLVGVAMLRSGSGRWTGLAAAVAAVALVLVAPRLDAVTPQGVSSDRYELSGLGQDQSVTDRLDQLQVIGPALAQPFGGGPASSTVATRLSGSDQVSNTDNGYVTLLLEGGLVRLVLFLVLGGLAVRAAVRRVRTDGLDGPERQLALVVLAVLLYVLVLQTSYNVVDGAAGLVYWIAVGTALTWHRDGVPAPSPVRPGARARGGTAGRAVPAPRAAGRPWAAGQPPTAGQPTAAGGQPRRRAAIASR